MRISEAAASVGVPAHVLRHWEDEGVLRPARSGANQREFDRQLVDEARIVHRLRQAGVSLPAIKRLRASTSGGRAAVLAAEADSLAAVAARTLAAADYLRHVSTCRHPVVEECPECREYADSRPG